MFRFLLQAWFVEGAFSISGPSSSPPPIHIAPVQKQAPPPQEQAVEVKPPVHQEAPPTDVAPHDSVSVHQAPVTLPALEHAALDQMQAHSSLPGYTPTEHELGQLEQHVDRLAGTLESSGLPPAAHLPEGEGEQIDKTEKAKKKGKDVPSGEEGSGNAQPDPENPANMNLPPPDESYKVEPPPSKPVDQAPVDAVPEATVDHPDTGSTKPTAPGL